MRSTSQVSVAALAPTFVAVRDSTRALVSELNPSDFEAQSMPDASPLKWHLAHTTWFFEEFVLKPHEEAFQPWHPAYRFLFNSYYDAVGQRQPRHQRGLLSRPTLEEVFAYRAAIEERVVRLLERDLLQLQERVELGCHHEQQHQELMLTDLKHLFAHNPLNPSYTTRANDEPAPLTAFDFIAFDGGLVEVGAPAQGFAFDNERPRHKVFLEPFLLATRLVTNGEFAEFISDGGYRRPELWLDQGFAQVRAEGWTKPLYWRGHPGEFREFTLHGERELAPSEPVAHLSYFEADAFARWAGARLPREAEWEFACQGEPLSGNFIESQRFHPEPARATRGLRQCFGDVWEWTQSAYSAYPGYHPVAGALGEYNGKFMSGQMVLRGGSCATPERHIRPSYRNFFPPSARWQFTGLRLAKDRTPTS